MIRQDNFKVLHSNKTHALCRCNDESGMEMQVRNDLDACRGDMVKVEYYTHISHEDKGYHPRMIDKVSGYFHTAFDAQEQQRLSKREAYQRMYNGYFENNMLEELKVRTGTPIADWSIIPAKWTPKQTPTEEKEMQNHLVELLAKNFYTIGINFEHSTKSYTYKVALDTKLEVDDKVIVDSTSGLTIVNVVRVDEDASGIDLTTDYKYKFIVQKLDTTEYDKLCDKDKAIGKVIAQGAAERARRDLIEAYTGNLNEEQVKALEDCGVTSVKRLD